MSTRLTPSESAALVAAAAGGDRQSWENLVDGYIGLIWATTRAYRLSDSDAHDVCQITWLRLIENIERLTDPARIGAWLATTARRECLGLLRQSRRVVLLWDWEDLDAADAHGEEPDAGILRLEQGEVVREVLEQLSPSCQALMRLLLLDPPPSYEEIGAALDMPIGSIGPTRGRCLRKLERLMAERGITKGIALIPGR